MTFAARLELPVAVRDAREEDLPWFIGFAATEHVEQCRAALGRPDVRLLVATGPSDLPLGELFLRLEAGGAVVDTVCVHGPVRGIGIGALMMTVAEEVAVAAGARRIGLGVEATNHGAIRLYERLGYRPAGPGERKGASSRGLLVMEKPL